MTTRKVSKISDAKKKCVYCGVAAADDHPDFTCPRIESIQLLSDETVVNFISPKKWEKYKKNLLGAKQG